MIWFVGAGCYHPDMLTIGAKKLLEQADCVLYDHLVNLEFLEYTKEECECICVGKRGHHASFLQKDILTLLVEKDQEYSQVVRLKGGDPFLFARGSEEMRYVLEHGCDCQYVPGISSAIGALGYAGIPVTQRHTATGFIVHTMHYQDGKDHLNYDAIAHEKNTQIFFMGSHKIKHLVQECLQHGMKEDTPIALGSHLSYPHQKVLCSTLKEIIHQDLTSFDAPLLIVIGDVVKEQSLLNNASRLSCFSKQVLFCSVDTTSWPIDDLLLKKGIFTHTRQVAQPVYEYEKTWNPEKYEILVFSSRHAVKGFFKALQEQRIDIRSLSQKFYCIGQKTKEQLEEKGVFCQQVFSCYQDLMEQINETEKICYIKAEEVETKLPSFSCYRMIEKKFDLPAQPLDAIAVTCPQALKILDKKRIDKNTPVFCFGRKSREMAERLGFSSIHVCPSSKEGIVHEIVSYFEG